MSLEKDSHLRLPENPKGFLSGKREHVLFIRKKIASFDVLILPSFSETDYLYDPNYKVRGIPSLPVESRVLNPVNSTVSNQFEADGDLSRIYGKANSNATERTYANSFSYTPDGRIEKLRLGNSRWEWAKFNERLQVTELNSGFEINDGIANALHVSSEVALKKSHHFDQRENLFPLEILDQGASLSNSPQEYIHLLPKAVVFFEFSENKKR